jgi:hypothetical protein
MRKNKAEFLIRKLFIRLCSFFPHLKVKLEFIEAVDLPKCYGQCQPDQNKFILQIVRKDFACMSYTLVHEFAHCLHFDEKNPHSEEWGKVYTNLWKLYVGESDAIFEISSVV